MTHYKNKKWQKNRSDANGLVFSLALYSVPLTSLEEKTFSSESDFFVD